MLERLRHRARPDTAQRGFALVELLVVILVIAALAAIAIPSFLHEQTKAHDADAKLGAGVAARAMGACALDHDDSYASCSLTVLRALDPSLAEWGSRLSVGSGADHFRVVVASRRDSGAAVFTLSRSADGSSSRSCSTGAAEKGGCSATTSGTW